MEDRLDGWGKKRIPGNGPRHLLLWSVKGDVSLDRMELVNEEREMEEAYHWEVKSTSLGDGCKRRRRKTR